jgi:hypothetical protein
MKFRKKPVVIEAEQWLGPESKIDGVYHDDDAGGWWIQTLEGQLRVSAGDWIITGVKGEKYPCKSDIFEATYEQVIE